MGYYSTFDYDGNAKIDLTKVEELNKRIKEECKHGFKEAIIEAKEDGDFHIGLDDFYQKFYDDEEFANLLSEYIVEGKLVLYFEGEDHTNWCWSIYPNFVINKDVKYFNKEDIKVIQEDKEISDITKSIILKDFKDYWEEQLKTAKENLNILHSITSL